MSSGLRYALGALLWAAGAYGILQLAFVRLPVDLDHYCCGPWG